MKLSNIGYGKYLNGTAREVLVLLEWVGTVDWYCSVMRIHAPQQWWFHIMVGSYQVPEGLLMAQLILLLSIRSQVAAPKPVLNKTAASSSTRPSLSTDCKGVWIKAFLQNKLIRFLHFLINVVYWGSFLH